MKPEEKKVIVPWYEYQELKEKADAFTEAKAELAKDSKERGFYVETRISFNDAYGTYGLDIPRLSIVSKDKVLEMAQNEMERLTETLKENNKANEEIIQRLRSRNLWDRIFNRI